MHASAEVQAFIQFVRALRSCQRFGERWDLGRGSGEWLTDLRAVLASK